MEDRKLPITVGQGAGAAVVTLDLPAFTLIGATTRAGLLTTPLRDRFGVTHRLELYGPADLARIVLRSAGILEVEIDAAAPRRSPPARAARPAWPTGCSSACATSPRCAAGTSTTRSPARRSTCSRSTPPASTGSTARSCARSAQKFGGGPGRPRTLAVAVAEEADTIEDVYEPYLLQQGFLMRTPRGPGGDRCAFAHLGSSRPAKPERSERLF